jgi:hypothetical protein
LRPAGRKPDPGPPGIFRRRRRMFWGFRLAQPSRPRATCRAAAPGGGRRGGPPPPPARPSDFCAVAGREREGLWAYQEGQMDQKLVCFAAARPSGTRSRQGASIEVHEAGRIRPSCFGVQWGAFPLVDHPVLSVVVLRALRPRHEARKQCTRARQSGW